jgi:mutator protein MutT
VHVTREMMVSNLLAFEKAAVQADHAVRHAAVALAVVQGATEPELLITRRAGSLRAHAGQWALPGGRLDEGETPRQAALRELSEEVGLNAPADAVLGELDDFVTRSGYRMTPVVVWAADLNFTPVPNEGEVASIHHLSMDALSVPPNLLKIEESDRPVIQMPVGDSLIHAPTGAILHQFAEVALHGRSTRVAHYEQPVFAWK